MKATDFDNLDLLPADFSYRNMDLELDDAKKRTRRLDQLLSGVADEYDIVFLDCPPSVSLVSENVLRAADVLLVPLIPATLSLRTYAQLTRFVADAPRPRPQVVAFFSMADRRKRLHREVIDASRATAAGSPTPSSRRWQSSSRWPSSARRSPLSRRRAGQPSSTSSCGRRSAMAREGDGRDHGPARLRSRRVPHPTASPTAVPITAPITTSPG